VSPTVQALLSSQGLVLKLWKQPDALSQPSVVQGFVSSQSFCAPTQMPLLHCSFTWQAFVLTHGSVL
jgi:hypothetical protein